MTLELTGNDALELQIAGQFTEFWPMRSIPGGFIRLIGSITFQATVAIDFPTNCRGSTAQLTRDCAQGKPDDYPLDISSRCERVSASLERWRPGGRKPPKRAKFLVIAE
jgi:hypothetical protein